MSREHSKVVDSQMVQNYIGTTELHSCQSKCFGAQTLLACSTTLRVLQKRENSQLLLVVIRLTLLEISHHRVEEDSDS